MKQTYDQISWNTDFDKMMDRILHIAEQTRLHDYVIDTIPSTTESESNRIRRNKRIERAANLKVELNDLMPAFKEWVQAHPYPSETN